MDVATVVRSADGRERITADARAAAQDRHFPGVQRFGVVLDAEEDPADARKIGQEALTLLGCPHPIEHGHVLTVGTERWGLFLLPDGTSKGALETLLRASAPANAPWVACANAWEACTNVSRIAAQRDKAWLRVAGMAWPDLRKGWLQMLGAAGGLDLRALQLAPLRAFLRALEGP